MGIEEFTSDCAPSEGLGAFLLNASTGMPGSDGPAHLAIALAGVPIRSG
jgi:hypothetical protein